MFASKYHFDQAATSYPKAPGTVEAVAAFMRDIGANSGRGAYWQATQSSELLLNCREKVGSLIGISNPMRIILTSSATMALNMAIQGSLKLGDHVITTSLEHNSTIRILKEMEKSGLISVSIVSIHPGQSISFDDFNKELRAETSCLVINHASNVWGTSVPIKMICDWAKKNNLMTIVDGSQSVGILPLDVVSDQIDILCFSGHKALLGPMGTGVMALSPKFDHHRLRPIIYGGTGSNSAEIFQPRFLPDAFESGTLNIPGFVGLDHSVGHILQQGVESIHLHKAELARYFSSTLREMTKYQLYIDEAFLETGVVSFNHRTLPPAAVGDLLAKSHGVSSRVGLHCAPLAHQMVGTFPAGTVRFSFSSFHQKEELDCVLSYLKEID